MIKVMLEVCVLCHRIIAFKHKYTKKTTAITRNLVLVNNDSQFNQNAQKQNEQPVKIRLIK